jgi:predicted  nucleic acid-binding Zn-ribbon protein
LKASVEDQNRLIELQRVDSHIQNLQLKLKSLPELEQLAAIEAQIATGEEILKTATMELGDVEVELKRSEIEVEQVSDRIKKDENRLNAGQGSPKELEQMQHEIGTLQKRKSDLEDGELEIMLRFDAAKAKVATLNNNDAGLKQLHVELKARYESASNLLNEEIVSETAKRNSQVPGIDKPLIELYEKVRSATGGVGAALLIGNTCDGCHLAITPVELEKIKSMPADDVVRCEECRRILVRI